MTQQELAAAIFAANDVALQWYAVTHNQPVAGAPGTITVSPRGATFGSGTLVLAGLALLAVVFLLKK